MNRIVIVLAISLLLTGCSQEVNNPYEDIELNPCPMCGGQVVINDYRYGYWITRSKLWCQTRIILTFINRHSHCLPHFLLTKYASIPSSSIIYIGTIKM